MMLAADYKRILFKIFELENTSPGAQSTVDFVPSGPAYLSDHRILDGVNECWQQLNCTPPQKNAKVQFIYCAGSAVITQALIKGNVSIFHFIHELMKHGDVFIWPSSKDMALLHCNPLKSPQGFWEAVDRYSPLHCATKEDVLKNLVEQGIAIDQFKILDDVTFTEILAQGKNVLRNKTVFKDGDNIEESPITLKDNPIELLEIKNFAYSLKKMCNRSLSYLDRPIEGSFKSPFPAFTLNFINPNAITEMLLELRKTVVFSKDIVLETKIDFILSGLKRCSKLEALTLKRRSLLEMATLSSYQTLKELTIEMYDHSYIIEHLKHFTQLEFLELVCCDHVKELDLTELSQLRVLRIQDCKNIIHIKGLEYCTLLSVLKLIGTPQLCLPQFFNLKNLKILKILSFTLCRDFDLSHHPYLVYLDISSAQHLNILGLENCPQLEHLQVWGNLENLNDIPPNCRHLKVSLIEQREIFKLNLSNARHLLSLKIVSANREVEIEGFKSCQQLNKLDIIADKLKGVDGIPQSCKNPAVFCFSSLILDDLDRSQIPYFNRNPNDDVQSTFPFANQTYNSMTRQALLCENELNPQPQSKVNPVACFSLAAARTIDGYTSTPAKTNQATGSLNVELIEAGKRHTIDDYRIEICHQIKYVEATSRLFFSNAIDSNQLIPLNSPESKIFSSTKQKTLSTFIQDWLSASPHVIVGSFEGQLQSGQYYPLTSLRPVDQDCLTHICNDSPEKSIQCAWSKTHQQYYIQPQTTGFFRFGYCFKFSHPAYHYGLPNDESIIQADAPLLSTVLREVIEQRLRHSQLAFLWNNSISIARKVRSLFLLCQNFSNEALSSKAGTDLELLLRIIEEKKGVCRHRSEVFMLLTHYLQIPVRMIGNQRHRFCEIPYGKGDHVQWYRAELGGAAVEDLTEMMRPSLFDAPIHEAINRTPPHLAHPIATPSEESSYEALFEQQATANNLSTWDILMDQRDALLVLRPEDQAPLIVYERFARYLREKYKDRNLWYIDTACDFIRYTRPRQIQNDGKLHSIVGPLVEFIQSEKPDILLINWSDFSPTELASYKSLWDQPATLLGLSVSESIQIIGVTNTLSRMCPAFLSRCQQWWLADCLLLPLPQEEVLSNPSEAMLINLGHRYNWRELLLGHIVFTARGFSLIPGPLLEASTAQCPITIHNPPRNDPEFNAFLARLKQGRFFYNGQLHQSPPAVYCTDSLKEVNCPQGVRIQYAHDFGLEEDARQAIYLNRINLHECFRQLSVDAITHQVTTQPGLLEEINSNIAFFYVMDTLAPEEWQALWNHIQLYFPDKRIDFVLAQGVSVQSVPGILILEQATSIPIQETEPHHAAPWVPSDKHVFSVANIENASLTDIPSVMVTNDPDYLSIQLAAKQPNNTLIVDLTPQMGLQDFIAQINLFSNAENTTDALTLFRYHTRAAFNALKAGKTVMLNGSLSYMLYQQILPLLHMSKPTIRVNARCETVTGRLIVVMPLPAYDLSLVTYGKCDYEFKDYRACFSEVDQPKLNQLEKFYKAAYQWPLGGLGRPSTHALSYQRLFHGIQALKEGEKIPWVHQNNPIKSIFHGDYPKETEDYAYLNVMAKLIFAKTSTIVSFDLKRQAKLSSLIKKVDLSKQETFKELTWRLLNALPLCDLQDLFGNEVETAIESHAKETPSLTEAHFKKFQKILQEKQISFGQATPFASRRFQKQQERLSALFKDPKSPLIFIKGPPGVGKTYSVKAFKAQCHYYEGVNQLKAWLTDVPEQMEKMCSGGGDACSHIRLLLIDEANLHKKNGYWDFLKGLLRIPSMVYYQGETYPLTSNHKVILTGNLETEPGRYFHDFFRNAAKTILFQKPDRVFIQEKLWQPLHSAYRAYLDVLFAICDLVSSYQPFYPFSIRDFQRIAHRFAYCAQKIDPGLKKEMGIANALLKACRIEFAGFISEDIKRQQFLLAIEDIIRKHFGERLSHWQPERPMPLIPITNTYALPQEKAYLLEAIENNLGIRVAVQDGQETHYPPGTLITGDSGLGKSSFYKAVLEKWGFTKNTTDLSKKYTEISAGETEATQRILLEAFHKGTIVILDELNLEPDLEEFINTLLTGKDQYGKIADRPGFMVLASQNPGYFQGRAPTSGALQNRMHRFFMNPYKSKALEAITIYKGVNPREAKCLVSSFFKVQAKHPEINARHYFKACDKIVLG